MPAVKTLTVKSEAWVRKLVTPEEDQRRIQPRKPWDYRWFKADNVHCIEHYRRPDTKLDSPRGIVIPFRGC